MLMLFYRLRLSLQRFVWVKVKVKIDDYVCPVKVGQILFELRNTGCGISAQGTNARRCKIECAYSSTKVAGSVSI